MFEQGNNVWQQRKNTYKGGRLTKEQLAALADLVPKSIEVWRKILELPVTLKGASVQSETASKVMNKFVADLTETINEHGVDEGFAGLLKNIAERVSGKSAAGTVGVAEHSDQNGLQK